MIDDIKELNAHIHMLSSLLKKHNFDDQEIDMVLYKVLLKEEVTESTEGVEG